MEEDLWKTSTVISGGFYRQLAGFHAKTASYQCRGHVFHRFPSDSSPRPTNQRHQVTWSHSSYAPRNPLNLLSRPINLEVQVLKIDSPLDRQFISSGQTFHSIFGLRYSKASSRVNCHFSYVPRSPSNLLSRTTNLKVQGLEIGSPWDQQLISSSQTFQRSSGIIIQDI